MAEINTPAHNNQKKSLPKFIRVDLTPMVDLGFLLITFFILTTSLQQPVALGLILPKDSGIKTNIPESTTLTFILEGSNRIGYYEGNAKKIGYANFISMRNIIQQKQQQLTNRHINKNELILVFKPTNKCSYKNFVDAIDEVTITDCRHYYFDEPDQKTIAQ